MTSGQILFVEDGITGSLDTDFVSRADDVQTRLSLTNCIDTSLRHGAFAVGFTGVHTVSTKAGLRGIADDSVTRTVGAASSDTGLWGGAVALSAALLKAPSFDTDFVDGALRECTGSVGAISVKTLFAIGTVRVE